MDIEIIRDDFGLNISLVYDGQEVGHMTLEKDVKGNEYTIIDANIIPKFRGRGLYQ